jgi:hypothetical protein
MEFSRLSVHPKPDRLPNELLLANDLEGAKEGEPAPNDPLLYNLGLFPVECDMDLKDIEDLNDPAREPGREP